MLPVTTRGQIDYYYAPVTVTASRLPAHNSADMREILVLTRDEINNLPAESISTLLSYIGGVEVQRRGAGSVQADFSLRGCTFEQTVVMVDGVRIDNPQTGHHNADIPVSISEIERIEIMPGHSSSLYGPNGFGGVIHIITSANRQKQTNVKIRGGSFGTFSGTFSHSFKWGPMGSRISFEQQRSDGYRWDSDFNVLTASYSSEVKIGNKEFDLALGYNFKEFGANDFYANYPSREKTDSFNGRISMIWFPSKSIKIDSRIYSRRHNDKFILDFQRPLWYQNTHQTLVSGGELHCNYHFSDKSALALGMDVVDERITSTNLNIHQRWRMGLWGEFVTSLSTRSSINGGVRIDCQRGWDLQINPSLGFKYVITPALHYRSSISRIYRTPTFTELYYESPANKGNPLLKPEYGWSYETGLTWGRESNRIDVTVFFRNERNRINWISYKELSVWQVINTGRANIAGISISANRSVSQWLRLRFNYTSLPWRSVEDKGYSLKYENNVPKHNFIISGISKLSRSIRQSIVVVFKKPVKGASYILLNSKCSYLFAKYSVDLEIFNLLDVKYEEIPGVPMPGRSIMAGCEIRL